MVRIVHISDTHLGNRQYGSDVRRQDFTDSFEAAVEHAIKHDADAILHTGDLFHRRTPPLPQVNQCIDILRRAADAEIPFYGIVGNHDRKMDDQWLDLIERSGTAARLGRSPTMVGGSDGDDDDVVALYGIDAIPSPAWESTDFSLDEPDNDDAYRLLCMHQLLYPPVPKIMAEYSTESVIKRLSIDIDGLALGDYHEAVSKTVESVDVWYAGSTERASIGEEGPRSITLLSGFKNGNVTRQQLDLDTREFQSIKIDFAEDEGYAHARDEIANYDVTDKVAVIKLSGKRTSLTASDVHEIALDRGAAVVRVDDDRGRKHLEIGEVPSTEVEDPDTLINQRLAAAGLSEPALDVDELVRDETIPKNGLDETATEIITEAQDVAFSGENPPDTVLSTDADQKTEKGNVAVSQAERGEERDVETKAEESDASEVGEPDGDKPSMEMGAAEVASREENVATGKSDRGSDTDSVASAGESVVTCGSREGEARSGETNSKNASECPSGEERDTTNQVSFTDLKPSNSESDADTNTDGESDST